MNLHVTNALICLKDDFDIEYVICEIEYKVWESEEFEYRFRPIYSVIDLLDSNLFQGIPGLDLNKRKPEYVRKNIVPTFIAERAPNSNREDLWKLLDECEMHYLNQLEWLIRTNTQYVGDRLYVKEMPLPDEKKLSFSNVKRSVDLQKRLLEYICAGRSFSYEGFTIDDSNRSVCYHLLYRLFRREAERIKVLQTEGIQRAKAEGRYQGRKPIRINELALDEVLRKYRSKQISAREAAEMLGISMSTFYRRLERYGGNGRYNFPV